MARATSRMHMPPANGGTWQWTLWCHERTSSQDPKATPTHLRSSRPQAFKGPASRQFSVYQRAGVHMEPTPAAPRIHLQSPQTAVPTRAVEPGRTRRITVAAPPLPPAALQRRTRVVLYYRADAAGADGRASVRLWEEAMWAKESLSEAVADHPEMGGRLRRHADGSWEVKLNDAGVRFTEATAEATLDEFLAAAQDKDRAPSWEAALAPWADVNAEDPDVSALVYVQVSSMPMPSCRLHPP